MEAGETLFGDFLCGHSHGYVLQDFRFGGSEFHIVGYGSFLWGKEYLGHSLTDIAMTVGGILDALPHLMGRGFL